LRNGKRPAGSRLGAKPDSAMLGQEADEKKKRRTSQGSLEGKARRKETSRSSKRRPSAGLVGRKKKFLNGEERQRKVGKKLKRHDQRVQDVSTEGSVAIQKIAGSERRAKKQIRESASIVCYPPNLPRNTRLDRE